MTSIDQTSPFAADGSPVENGPVAAPDELWVERTGTRTYTGRNSRGGEVKIAPLDTAGAFSPGELLKIALAGCTGLTADEVIARRLGADFQARIDVAGVKDLEVDRYPELTEEFHLDLSGLADKERAKLLTILRRAVEEHCTVSRTITHGTVVELTIVDTPAGS